jgi:hypothetical protein
MSTGRDRYSHIIPVKIGDVIKQSCGCNQVATGTRPGGAGTGPALGASVGRRVVGGRCAASAGGGPPGGQAVRAHQGFGATRTPAVIDLACAPATATTGARLSWPPPGVVLRWLSHRVLLERQNPSLPWEDDPSAVGSSLGREVSSATSVKPDACMGEMTRCGPLPPRRASGLGPHGSLCAPLTRTGTPVNAAVGGPVNALRGLPPPRAGLPGLCWGAWGPFPHTPARLPSLASRRASVTRR